MSDLFDHRQVRRAFSRAAQGYDSAAALQREVEASPAPEPYRIRTGLRPANGSCPAIALAWPIESSAATRACSGSAATPRPGASRRST